LLEAVKGGLDEAVGRRKALLLALVAAALVLEGAWPSCYCCDGPVNYF